jgi:hypothetical protein
VFTRVDSQSFVSALRMWTDENTLKGDILQPVISSNTSKSVCVILTTFLKPSPTSTLK